MKTLIYLVTLFASISVPRTNVRALSISGSSTVCVGATTTLRGSSSGGTWSSSSTTVATIGSSSGVVSGIISGTTIITYRKGTSTATKTVTVLPLPSVGTISGPSTVQVFTTITLTCSPTGGTWSSSAMAIANVSSSGVVSGAGVGSAVISYRISNSCGPATATTTISVTPVPPPTSPKIPLDGKRWYLLNNCSNGLERLHDSDLANTVTTSSGKILSTYDAYYPVLPGEQISIESIRFFSPSATSFSTKSLKLYYIDSLWKRILLGTYQGGALNTWVGPYPSSPGNYNLSTPVNNARYLLISCNDIFPNELELYGSYTPPNAATLIPAKTIQLKQELGVNAFEWDFLDSVNHMLIDEKRVKAVNSFRGVRHYLDWQKLEMTSGKYTFNPTRDGGWNLDTVYARAKADGIEILTDLKTIPPWIVSTYSSSNRDNENTPVNSSGLDFANPNSYSKQAKVAFQFAARYGYNTAVNPALVTVDASLRFTGDSANKVKIGLGLVRYIECDNERDKTWKGRKAYQTGREYAANLSAFYDGNKNSMGPGVGVKNADSSMQVVMGGISLPHTDYVRGMIDWCKEFRGYKPDGSINLCWDVINYHVYPDDSSSIGINSTRGKSADATRIDTFATNFIKVAHELCHDMPVWITETGYDVSQSSPKNAIPIGTKSVEQVRADWTLRHALLNARIGIERTFFYVMYANALTSPIQYASAGLINPNKTRKPPADYLYQTNKLLGEYYFIQTISTNPLVDVYALNGDTVYVMVKPSEDGSTVPYTFPLNVGDSVLIYTPAVGQDSMNLSTMMAADTGNAVLTVSETPIFVRHIPGAPAERQATSTTVPPNTILKEMDVLLFPNPTTGGINLIIDNPVESEVTVVTHTQDGRTSRRTSYGKCAGKDSRTIDLRDLPSGILIMEVEQKNERIVKKIIKVNQ